MGTSDRIWQPKPPLPIEDLYVWVDHNGVPAVFHRLGSYVLASTTPSIDIADAPNGSTPTRPGDAAALAAMIPTGYGLIIDKASGSSTPLAPETIDALRPGAIPNGSEEGLVFHSAPARFRPLVDAARNAAKRVGAHRVASTWVSFADGRPVLLLIVKPRKASDEAAALDAAYRTVEQHAPSVIVRVMPATALGTARMLKIAAAQPLPEPTPPDPDPNAAWGASGPGIDPRKSVRTDASGNRPIHGRSPLNVSLALFGGLVGAFLIGLPHQLSTPIWLSIPLVALGILFVVVFLALAYWDFFRRDP